MAVAFDAKMAGGNGAGGTFQQSSAATSISSAGMTIGGSGSCLIAFLHIQAAATNISMTWNGVSMSAHGATTDVNTHTETVAMFALPNPATGNKTLAGSWTTAGDAYMSCVSFSGTDTVTGVKTANDITTTRTQTLAVVTDATGATVVAFTGDSATPTVDQTQIWSGAPLGPSGGASYAIGGTGTNTHTFTGGGDVTEALVGVHVIVPQGAIPSSGAYQQEQSTTDRYLLEDGSGVYLIEPWGSVSSGIFPPWWYGDLSGIGSPGRFFKDRLN